MTTTTTAAPANPMQGWRKGGLLAALVFGLCWGLAIFYWHATDRSPTTGDLLLYLLALPAAVFMASGFARTRLTKPTAAPAAAAAASAQPAAAHTGPPPLAILAVSLRSPHGESPEELSAAITNNKARADLDGELLDDDGFPVMTARSGDAVDEALREEIAEWWTTNGMPSSSFGDEQWRALTMASAVAGELAGRAACDLMPAEGAAPVLQLRLVLPPEWHGDQRRAAAMWLKHTVVQFGWPQACVALAEQAQAIGPSAILGELAHEAAGRASSVAIVVACASNIGEETVGKWAADGALFTSTRPQGLIPGEGAAGLLLTGLHQARAVEDAAFTLLDQVVEARRESSADHARRIDAALLTELAERALRRGAAALSDVAMVVADTGHRANRAHELMGFAAGALPQLDGTGDVVCTGAASGTCGAVPFVTALALAHHHTLERNAPVLCISNEDPYLLCTAFIRPAGSPEKQDHASA